jgi:hypothetical protein
MSPRLLVATAVAVSLLSLTCIAKSNTEQVNRPVPVTLSEAALEGESVRPVTCGAAFRIAEHHGYGNVKVQTCFGSEYAFRAVKDGRKVIVHVDPANGRLWQGKILR